MSQRTRNSKKGRETGKKATARALFERVVSSILRDDITMVKMMSLIAAVPE